MTTFSYNSASACLFAILMVSYFSICDGSLSESVQISTDENNSTTVPETTIPQGTIRGINMLTRKNRTVFGFIGIPYAQPPVGDLRFSAPVPASPWNGTFDANDETEPCPQINDQQVVAGDEDCLYLNLFTPQLPASDNSTLLPVMIYIIGGGFKTENNSLVRYGPEFLLDEDVVLVVPNFRVGVLGFLSTGDEVSPGNYGLKDAVQSLKWIQDSIQYFGGDPNRVTLFGGSAGAMSVHLLALSNLTEGLIHQFITESGTALSNTAHHPREACAKRALQLGEHLGCPTNTSTLLIDCLKGLSVSQLVETSSIFYVWGTYPLNVWNPTTEPDIEGALLTDTPENLYAAGKIRDLPWIALVTREEGLMSAIQFYEDPDLFEDFLENIDLALPEILEYEDKVDDVTAYTNALKAYYLNDLTANRSLLLANVTLLLGDGQFVYSVYNSIQQQQMLAKSPVYFCSFNYRGIFSYSYLFSGGSTAYTSATHGDELIYLFGHQDYRLGPREYDLSEVDFFMIDTVVQLWTSFASNGTPSVPDAISTATWDQYSSLNNYLRIGNASDTTLEMDYDLYLERMQFWRQLNTVTAASGQFRNALPGLTIALCFCFFAYF